MPDTMRAPSTTTTPTSASRSGPSRRSGRARCSCASRRSASAAPTCSSGTACPRRRSCSGHEVAGDIVEVGEGVDERRAWATASCVSHHVPCNTCRYCLTGNHTACHTLHTTNFDPGGFAEYVRVPALQTDRGILRAARLDDATRRARSSSRSLRGARTGARRRASGLDGAGDGQRHLAGCCTSGSRSRSAPVASSRPT